MYKYIKFKQQQKDTEEIAYCWFLVSSQLAAWKHEVSFIRTDYSTSILGARMIIKHQTR